MRSKKLTITPNASKNAMGHLPRCEVESPALVGDVLIIPRIYEQSFSNLRIWFRVSHNSRRSGNVPFGSSWPSGRSRGRVSNRKWAHDLQQSHPSRNIVLRGDTRFPCTVLPRACD